MPTLSLISHLRQMINVVEVKSAGTLEGGGGGEGGGNCVSALNMGASLSELWHNEQSCRVGKGNFSVSHKKLGIKI